MSDDLDPQPQMPADATPSALADAARDRAKAHDDEAVITFMLGAVRDEQMTIRGVDTKVSILLAALSLPLRYSPALFTGMHHLGGISALALSLSIAAAASYLASAYIALRTLVGVTDTNGVIAGVSRYSTFFAGGLFSLGWADLFVQRQLRARMTLGDFIEEVPRTAAQVVEDLAAEIVALAYIRDLKLYRQRAAFVLGALAAVLAVIRLSV